MHIAIAKGKCRDPIKEDLVTSMFFGTMQYLPAVQVAAVLTKAMAIQLIPRDLHHDMSDPDIEVEFDFWPNIARRRRIEPDVIIRFSSPKKGFVLGLMIECKWDSGLSGDDQLWNQWKALNKKLTQKDQQKIIHIYLTKDVQQALRDLERIDRDLQKDDLYEAWRRQRLVLSWTQITHAICAEAQDLTPANKVWTKNMSALFKELGITQFHGFKGLYEKYQEKTPIVFWHPFRGFLNIGATRVEESQQPTFYQKCNKSFS